MVKIVIFVAIVALACVNAQHYAFAGSQVGAAGAASDLLKQVQMMNRRNLGMLSPYDMINQNNNMRIMTPEDIINKKPGPHENYHAVSVNSQSTGDGKVLTSMYSNINGKKEGYTITN